ncbi:hypothetical protein Halar_2930 [halophilic archaeon DL31]|jgi:hypothetical protein|nr:hypothetical protein Halar_2930 [halophilic archaeon DL31]
MNRSGVLVAGLLASLLLTSAVGAAADSGGFDALQNGDVETDSVVLRATVDENGDATWTIDYRIRLDDQNTTSAYESVQQDIRNNASDYRGQFATRMRSTVAAAENATGRKMAVENVTVSADTTLSGQYGVVSYRFHWTGFAATDGNRILLGDSLAGLFLDADTKLVFSWPEGYELQRVDPEPTSRDDRSVTWEGPVDFGTNQPRLVIGPAGLLPAWVSTAGVVGLGLLVPAAGVWYYRRRESAGSGPAAPTPSAMDEPAEPDATEAGVDTKRESSGQAGAASDTPEKLLSPEERVLALLTERGGRMKQKVVTEELDWSAARTSQVVGDLRDAGKVESFRLGRENVLKFPEEGEDSLGMQ